MPVSHDRYFIKNAIGRFENDKVMYYPFGYDHYISGLRHQRMGAGTKAKDAAMVEALAAVPKRSDMRPDSFQQKRRT